jgi:hypothetical protein
MRGATPFADSDVTRQRKVAVAGGRVVEIDVVVDPERLGRLDPALLRD